jgi:hypothetical protein
MSNVKAHMAHQTSADVLVEFRSVAEGGRQSAVSLCTGQYRPHLQVAGGEYLGVVFVGGPELPVQPGAGALATVDFVYEPGVSYAALTEGASFEVLEGPKVVAKGRVIRRRNPGATA